jgi:Fe-S-cluster-containing dehydrogenase component
LGNLECRNEGALQKDSRRDRAVTPYQQMKREMPRPITNHLSPITRANSSDEFAPGSAEWPDDLSRREFLRLMGASLALAGVGACTKQPIEKIVPYVKQPEQIVPGKPLYFASATLFNGYAQGIIVTSREGRPIKIEGNPDHPASLGATTIWAQAGVLDLYDPDRAQTVMHGENVSTWNDFLRELDLALNAQQSRGGAGLRILTETVASPTLGDQLRAVLKKFPRAKWHQWEPITRDSMRVSGAGGIFGGESIYNFADAAVIVALDSDFLFCHPAALRHARDFASARRVGETPDVSRPHLNPLPQGEEDAKRQVREIMNRLYVAEPTPTITGSNADHRIPIAACDIRALAEAIGAQLGLTEFGTELPAQLAHYSEWILAAARDLEENSGAGIVVAGETQPPAVHALAGRINERLGNIGVTISPRPPVEFEPVNQIESLRHLVDEMKAGAVDLLIVLGGNPVFNSPIDFGFADGLAKVKLCVHHSLYPNETSRKCHWLIPATHFLESWSDACAFDGSVSIIQPLIEPLYANVSVHEMIGALIEQPVRSAYEIVRENWRGSAPIPNFELRWRQALSRGVTSERRDLAQRNEQPLNFILSPSQGERVGRGASLPRSSPNELEILFRPDPNILDGRYANNGWLQELPRPFTKLTWENAALISPALAQREKIDNGDVVELSFRGRKLTAPVWIQSGQAENSVTLHFGHGRSEIGRVGKGVGFNAYALRASDALWFGDGLTMRKTGEKYSLATTQHHHAMEGRDFLRTGTLAEFVADPKRIAKSTEEPANEETLYDPDEYKNRGYAWGMAIDLGACIGCSACTIACQAENNIPVVGKEQVARGREMHWIRVDTYESDKIDNPRFDHQPVPCMHCEHAPCELVCPVGATVHDSEGLNVQVYNRCIGTRYCSNNCPYKVRRFNFLEPNGSLSATEKLVKNPEVTVRSRGVMEKCTYCVQRISAARVTAELENRTIRDGEIVPACAQVCPTEAIVFGNIHDPNSRVAKLKHSPLNYSMLGELNTRPRTSYLAKLRNVNNEVVISD